MDCSTRPHTIIPAKIMSKRIRSAIARGGQFSIRKCGITGSLIRFRDGNDRISKVIDNGNRSKIGDTIVIVVGDSVAGSGRDLQRIRTRSQRSSLIQ